MYAGLMGIIAAFPRAMSQVARLESSYKDLKGIAYGLCSFFKKDKIDK
jgi:hypothetical protein